MKFEKAALLSATCFLWPQKTTAKVQVKPLCQNKIKKHFDKSETFPLISRLFNTVVRRLVHLLILRTLEFWKGPPFWQMEVSKNPCFSEPMETLGTVDRKRL